MLQRTALILNRAREITNEEKEEGIRQETSSLQTYTNLEPLQEVDFNSATDISEKESTHTAAVSPKTYSDLQTVREVEFNLKLPDIIYEEGSNSDGYSNKENEIGDVRVMDDNQNQEEDRQSGRKEYRQDLNFVNRDINEDNNIVEMEQSDKGENDGEKNGVKSKEKKYQGRPKKGRKRKFPSQNREIRKKHCIQNKSYFTQKGEMKLKKEFRQYLCKCDCLSKVGIENAKQEYDKFYEVSSHDAQRALICAMVQEGPIKRKRKQNSTKKMHSRVYNINGHVVCKTFLLQTLRISSAKVDNALKSKKKG
ncbi:DNA ligase 1-like [Diabrotica virgifera virgifera]|uniref:Uncharacterized protein n=1 Tax=Diabrotica virgifera virgifera TaxID=50390 RepID=A0ABM5L2T4_DIAVI|nr:DNA ligase 1-like [Diabrotica virgifera virgifera]